jgi:glycine betaine transporter
MEDCLVCFLFTVCLHLLFNTGAKRSESKFIVFSTYYLWIGLISVIAALVILCLPLRKQRL